MMTYYNKETNIYTEEIQYGLSNIQIWDSPCCFIKVSSTDYKMYCSKHFRSGVFLNNKCLSQIFKNLILKHPTSLCGTKIINFEAQHYLSCIKIRHKINKTRFMSTKPFSLAQNHFQRYTISGTYSSSCLFFVVVCVWSPTFNIIWMYYEWLIYAGNMFQSVFVQTINGQTDLIPSLSHTLHVISISSKFPDHYQMSHCPSPISADRWHRRVQSSACPPLPQRCRDCCPTPPSLPPQMRALHCRRRPHQNCFHRPHWHCHRPRWSRAPPRSRPAAATAATSFRTVAFVRGSRSLSALVVCVCCW